MAESIAIFVESEPKTWTAKPQKPTMVNKTPPTGEMSGHNGS